jgi:nitrous oxidase accessory protein
MNKNITCVSVLGLMFALMLGVVCLGSYRTAKGASTIIVPDDYSTIQEAINNAADGNTVFVKTGTYYEHVVVNRTISLLGEDVSTTIIDGNNTGHVISIVSDNVTLASFTVQRGGGTMFPDYDAGVSLKNARGCEISGSNIVDNGCFGIHLLESSQNLVTGNNFTRNMWYAIDLTTSNSNVVSSNTVVFNGNIGVGMHYSSQNNIILENTILNNTCGLDAARASNNAILGNYLANNSETGIWIQDYAINNAIFGNNVTGSRYCIKIEGQADSNAVSGNILADGQSGMQIARANTILNNNIINNTQQVRIVSGSVNAWNGSYASGGNYWSDYNGTDANQDGIGDTQYVIDVDNADGYPLIGMFSCFNVALDQHVTTICNSTISDFQFNGTAVMFNVTGVEGTTGFCRICVPTSLMNATYRVLLNGKEVSCNLLPCSNNAHGYLYFTYAHSTQEVIIIPEFPSFLILPLIFIATPLAVAIYRRKRC